MVDTIKIDDVTYVKESDVKKRDESKVQIVILQRGWVVIGKYSEKGDEFLLEKAKVIRVWGTTKGLGEIAEGGPTSSTKLDDCPNVRSHKLTVIARMDVNEEKWSKYF
jgi:hypothetical protein